jgi:hypothetical protein
MNVAQINRMTDADLDRQDSCIAGSLRAGSTRLRDAILKARGLPTFTEIRWLPEPATSALSSKDMIRSIARFYSIRPDLMQTGSRKPLHVRARAVAMLAFKRCGYSHSHIARVIGLRDHSTVSHHIRRVAKDATPHELELVNRLVPVVVEDGDVTI